MPQDTHATTEAPDHGAAEKPNLLKPEPGLALWTVITFVILLVILKKLAWGPMLDALDRREKAIQDALQAAEKARAEAATQAAEQTRILQEARREAKDLLTQGRADAERARAEMASRGREEAERIVKAGREAVEQEKLVAIQEIRQVAVDLAIAASSKLLKARIDDAKSRELVRGYVEEIGRQPQRPA